MCIYNCINKFKSARYADIHVQSILSAYRFDWLERPVSFDVGDSLEASMKCTRGTHSRENI